MKSSKKHEEERKTAQRKRGSKSLIKAAERNNVNGSMA
jgi:hypothetical protein